MTFPTFKALLCPFVQSAEKNRKIGIDILFRICIAFFCFVIYFVAYFVAFLKAIPYKPVFASITGVFLCVEVFVVLCVSYII